MANVTTTTVGVLELPTVSLHYETRGAGPLLLLIPGMTGTGTTFLDLAEHLSAHYTVATYDRRGYSRSTTSEEVTPETVFTVHARDVVALLQHLSPQGPVTIFSSSSGAVIALDILYLRPTVVKAVVLHDPVLPALLPPPKRAMVAEMLVAVQGALRNSGAAAASRIFMPLVTTENERKLLRSSPRFRAATAMTVENMARFFGDELTAGATVTADTGLLKDCGIRIHCANGADSTLDFTAYPVSVIAAQLGVPISTLPGGHLGFVTHSEGFARELLKILRGDRASL